MSPIKVLALVRRGTRLTGRESHPPVDGLASRLSRVRLGLAVGAVAIGLFVPACDRQSKTPPALPPAVVVVSQPVERMTAEYLEYTGNTAAIESVEIRARVKGFLQSIQFEPRAKVKKDDVLFKIEPDQYEAKLAQAKAEVDGNKARLDMAEYDVNRIENLLTQDAAAVYEHNQAIAKRDEAKAALAASHAAVDDAQLNVWYTQVKAPISGRISRNMVDAGNLVEAGTTLLATITKDDDVYVYFDVSEADVLRLKAKAATTQPGRPEHLNYPPAYVGLMNESGYPHAGQLDYYSPTLDSSTGTIEVRGRFPNQNGDLLPGLFARIRVPVGKPRKTICVSEMALGIDQGQYYLLVVSDKNVVEYRRVKVGLLDEGLRTIEEGIAPTDWVITSGMQRVRPGAAVNVERTPMVGQAATATGTAPANANGSASKTAD